MFTIIYCDEICISLAIKKNNIFPHYLHILVCELHFHFMFPFLLGRVIFFLFIRDVYMFSGINSDDIVFKHFFVASLFIFVFDRFFS